MKMIKYLSRAVSLLLCLVILAGCSGNEGAETQAQTDNGQGDIVLNVIDDNYRNYYEIFVYSFFDTNNDGIGDLKGVTAKLDYIKEMGYNGIWLMPIHPSPTYHKYDVADYYGIDPEYGTLADFDELVTQAHAKGINIIMDLVVNHTSTDIDYFKKACAYIKENGKPGGEYGDYYNFVNQNLSKYTQVQGTSYYYESQFWSGMPDLNLNSDKVRAEIVNIMKFWLTEHNVDGFRLDAVTSYYTGDIQKNVDFLSWLNTEAEKIKPGCYIVGEAWVGSDGEINKYYQSGVDSFFLFTGSQGTGTIATAVKQQSAKALGTLMTDLQKTYTNGILAPFLGNHDTMRPGSFLPGEECVKMAGGVLAMMNGSIFVYYGEEIGMISKGGNNSDPAKRIAMLWEDGVYPGWCYTAPENTKIDDTSYYYPSVAEQSTDENSILNYYKKAMQLRNMYPSIARGRVEYFSEMGNDYVCVITKEYNDEKITVVINLDSFEQKITPDKALLGFEGLAAQLCANASDKASLNDGQLVLPPYSIVILK